MAGFWLYLFLLVWAFGRAAQIRDNEVETEKKTTMNLPKMAPNSKFLNPFLDDDTNLQTAIGAFEDESKMADENTSWFVFNNMMLRYAVFILQITYGCYGCFPRRTKLLTDSYIPVAIQTLHHYNTQLQEYLPYTYTPLCKFEKKGTAPPPPGLSTNVCVDESLRRINLFLTDLQREATRRSLQDFQGFDRSVLAELRKTSHLTSAQQLYFVLLKLQQEGTGNEAFTCKIVEFLNDLENINSKLYRNLLNVKSLNYLDR